MKLSDKLSVRCYDKITRTGRVIYIHPDNIFAVLEFEGAGGNFREAVMLKRQEARRRLNAEQTRFKA